MWIDILLYNQPAVGEALERMELGLTELRRLLSTGDTQGLRRYLETARAFRQGIDR
jgi:prephenate dehydrogenase